MFAKHGVKFWKPTPEEKRGVEGYIRETRGVLISIKGRKKERCSCRNHVLGVENMNGEM